MPSPILTETIALELGVQEPWPIDVKLFQQYEVEQVLLPDNANCLAVQAYLKMCGLSFDVESRANAEFMSPSGHVPFLKCGPYVVADLDSIVSFVENKGISLTTKLDEEQKADMKAYKALINYVLGNSELYVCWLDKETYNSVTKQRYGSVFPWPLNLIQTRTKRSAVMKHLKSIKFAEKSLEEVYQDVETCCRSLSDRLNGKDYFFGSKPTELDALLFGHAFCICTMELPAGNRLPEIFNQYEFLLTHCRKIDKEYFGRERPLHFTPRTIVSATGLQSSHGPAFAYHQKPAFPVTNTKSEAPETKTQIALDKNKSVASDVLKEDARKSKLPDTKEKTAAFRNKTSPVITSRTPSKKALEKNLADVAIKPPSAKPVKASENKIKKASDAISSNSTNKETVNKPEITRPITMIEESGKITSISQEVSLARNIINSDTSNATVSVPDSHLNNKEDNQTEVTKEIKQINDSGISKNGRRADGNGTSDINQSDNKILELAKRSDPTSSIQATEDKTKEVTASKQMRGTVETPSGLQRGISAEIANKTRDLTEKADVVAAKLPFEESAKTATIPQLSEMVDQPTSGSSGVTNTSQTDSETLKSEENVDDVTTARKILDDKKKGGTLLKQVSATKRKMASSSSSVTSGVSEHLKNKTQTDKKPGSPKITAKKTADEMAKDEIKSEQLRQTDGKVTRDASSGISSGLNQSHTKRKSDSGKNIDDATTNQFTDLNTKEMTTSKQIPYPEGKAASDLPSGTDLRNTHQTDTIIYSGKKADEATATQITNEATMDATISKQGPEIEAKVTRNVSRDTTVVLDENDNQTDSGKSLGVVTGRQILNDRKEGRSLLKQASKTKGKSTRSSSSVSSSSSSVTSGVSDHLKNKIQIDKKPGAPKITSNQITDEITKDATLSKQLHQTDGKVTSEVSSGSDQSQTKSKTDSGKNLADVTTKQVTGLNTTEVTTSKQMRYHEGNAANDLPSGILELPDLNNNQTYTKIHLEKNADDATAMQIMDEETMDATMSKQVPQTEEKVTSDISSDTSVVVDKNDSQTDSGKTDGVVTDRQIFHDRKESRSLLKRVRETKGKSTSSVSSVTSGESDHLRNKIQTDTKPESPMITAKQITDEMTEDATVSKEMRETQGMVTRDVFSGKSSGSDQNQIDFETVTVKRSYHATTKQIMDENTMEPIMSKQVDLTKDKVVSDASSDTLSTSEHLQNLYQTDDIIDSGKKTDDVTSMQGIDKKVMREIHSEQVGQINGPLASDLVDVPVHRNLSDQRFDSATTVDVVTTEDQADGTEKEATLGMGGLSRDSVIQGHYHPLDISIADTTLDLSRPASVNRFGKAAVEKHTGIPAGMETLSNLPKIDNRATKNKHSEATVTPNIKSDIAENVLGNERMVKSLTQQENVTVTQQETSGAEPLGKVDSLDIIGEAIFDLRRQSRGTGSNIRIPKIKKNKMDVSTGTDKPHVRRQSDYINELAAKSGYDGTMQKEGEDAAVSVKGNQLGSDDQGHIGATLDVKDISESKIPRRQDSKMRELAHSNQSISRSSEKSGSSIKHTKQGSGPVHTGKEKSEEHLGMDSVPRFGYKSKWKPTSESKVLSEPKLLSNSAIRMNGETDKKRDRVTDTATNERCDDHSKFGTIGRKNSQRVMEPTGNKFNRSKFSGSHLSKGRKLDGSSGTKKPHDLDGSGIHLLGAIYSHPEDTDVPTTSLPSPVTDDVPVTPIPNTALGHEELVDPLISGLDESLAPPYVNETTVYHPFLTGEFMSSHSLGSEFSVMSHRELESNPSLTKSNEPNRYITGNQKDPYQQGFHESNISLPTVNVLDSNVSLVDEIGHGNDDTVDSRISGLDFQLEPSYVHDATANHPFLNLDLMSTHSVVDRPTVDGHSEIDSNESMGKSHHSLVHAPAIEMDPLANVQSPGLQSPMVDTDTSEEYDRFDTGQMPFELRRPILPDGFDMDASFNTISRGSQRTGNPLTNGLDFPSTPSLVDGMPILDIEYPEIVVEEMDENVVTSDQSQADDINIEIGQSSKESPAFQPTVVDTITTAENYDRLNKIISNTFSEIEPSVDPQKSEYPEIVVEEMDENENVVTSDQSLFDDMDIEIGTSSKESPAFQPTVVDTITTAENYDRSNKIISNTFSEIEPSVDPQKSEYPEIVVEEMDENENVVTSDQSQFDDMDIEIGQSSKESPAFQPTVVDTITTAENYDRSNKIISNTFSEIEPSVDPQKSEYPELVVEEMDENENVVTSDQSQFDDMDIEIGTSSKESPAFQPTVVDTIPTGENYDRSNKIISNTFSKIEQSVHPQKSEYPEIAVEEMDENENVVTSDQSQADDINIEIGQSSKEPPAFQPTVVDTITTAENYDRSNKIISNTFSEIEPSVDPQKSEYPEIAVEEMDENENVVTSDQSQFDDMDIEIGTSSKESPAFQPTVVDTIPTGENYDRSNKIISNTFSKIEQSVHPQKSEYPEIAVEEMDENENVVTSDQSQFDDMDIEIGTSSKESPAFQPTVVDTIPTGENYDRSNKIISNTFSEIEQSVHPQKSDSLIKEPKQTISSGDEICINGVEYSKSQVMLYEPTEIVPSPINSNGEFDIENIRLSFSSSSGSSSDSFEDERPYRRRKTNPPKSNQYEASSYKSVPRQQPTNHIQNPYLPKLDFQQPIDKPKSNVILVHDELKNALNLVQSGQTSLSRSYNDSEQSMVNEDPVVRFRSNVQLQNISADSVSLDFSMYSVSDDSMYPIIDSLPQTSRVVDTEKPSWPTIRRMHSDIPDRDEESVTKLRLLSEYTSKTLTVKAEPVQGDRSQVNFSTPATRASSKDVELNGSLSSTLSFESNRTFSTPLTTASSKDVEVVKLPSPTLSIISECNAVHTESPDIINNLVPIQLHKQVPTKSSEGEPVQICSPDTRRKYINVGKNLDISGKLSVYHEPSVKTDDDIEDVPVSKEFDDIHMKVCRCPRTMALPSYTGTCQCHLPDKEGRIAFCRGERGVVIVNTLQHTNKNNFNVQFGPKLAVLSKADVMADLKRLCSRLTRDGAENPFGLFDMRSKDCKTLDIFRGPTNEYQRMDDSYKVGRKSSCAEALTRLADTFLVRLKGDTKHVDVLEPIAAESSPVSFDEKRLCTSWQSSRNNNLKFVHGNPSMMPKEGAKKMMICDIGSPVRTLNFQHLGSVHVQDNVKHKELEVSAEIDSNYSFSKKLTTCHSQVNASESESKMNTSVVKDVTDSAQNSQENADVICYQCSTDIVSLCLGTSFYDVDNVSVQQCTRRDSSEPVASGSRNTSISKATKKVSWPTRLKSKMWARNRKKKQLRKNEDSDEDDVFKECTDDTPVKVFAHDFNNDEGNITGEILDSVDNSDSDDDDYKPCIG